jgi:hypothetical protein
MHILIKILAVPVIIAFFWWWTFGGGTQAQKRAEAKARMARQASRAASRAARDAQRPEAVAAAKAREEQYALARADHDARTYRAVISGCRIDPLKGGSFTLGTGDDLEMVFNVAANAALHFLSLRNGDVVQVTLNPAKTGLEEFWQLSRASGAKPRSPVELSAADMQWFGLTAEASPPRPVADP